MTHSTSSAQSDLKPCPFCGGKIGTGNPAEGHADDCYIVLLARKKGSGLDFQEAWQRRADGSGTSEPVDFPELAKLPWIDQSTADPIEKARRVLDSLIDESPVYFYDDGFPRVLVREQIANVMEVLNALSGSRRDLTCNENCNLGVGCDESGACYASAMGQPSKCGRAAAIAQATPDDDCKCRRLGDWKGAHHPLCDAATPPSPDANAHTIGEDAANVAIGEREAFEAWAKSKGLKFTCHAAHDYYSPHEVQCYYEVWQARAALTAEKVAGQEAVAIVRDNPDDIGTIIEATRPLEVGTQLYLAAPQQPAQPVEQALALTDEQIEDLQEAREILENMVRSVELDGNYSTEATCTFLRQALLCLPAAQPASSLADGGERE